METKTFAELGLSAKVQAAVEASGYSTPTPIQASAIPIAVTGQDVLGIAQTGTGKTASFVLPMITRLEVGRARARMPRSLILAPTRELAAQVAQSFEKYGVNHKLNVALLIGGVSMDEQVKKLDRGADVLIATPGRMLDHFQRGRLMLMGVEILVIDEADRMLDMGFIPDIEKICKLLPPKRQTLFFSATMPPEITRLVATFLTNPQRIEATRPATTANTITQRFHFCAEGTDWAKRDALRTLIRGEGVRNAIIFCNRKVEVAILLKSLLKHGFNAGALHGDMDQKSRMETLDKFRAGTITFLAASDVAARGLDIPDVSHVFNYDLPRDSDDYVHRIGRTGRAGKEGSSTSLVTREDLGKSLKDIEKIIGGPAVWIGEPPSEDDIANSGKRRGGRGGARGGAEARGGGREGRSGGGRDRGERAPQHGSRGSNGGQQQPGQRVARAAQLDAPVAGEAIEVKPQQDAGRAEQPRGERPERSARPERAPRGERGPRPEQQASGEPREDRGERPARGGRGPRPERAERPEGGARPERGERAAQPRNGEGRREQQPRHAEGRDQNARHAEGREQHPRQERGGDDRQNARARQPERDRDGKRDGGNRDNGAVGFADNVPAFLRRTSRPVKVANE
ncbi:MAG: DEAD/DEAH box helicase [Hyphomicrobiaceae bacterium]|nr:DEAD/DEAH box helicase [Hyphomicrobiaceae bacterium]